MQPPSTPEDRRRFRNRANRWEFGSVACQSLTAISAFVPAAVMGWPAAAALGVAGVVGAVACHIPKSRCQAAAEPPIVDNMSLHNTLKVLHDLLINFGPTNGDSKSDPLLRLCVFRVAGDKLIRITNHVGQGDAEGEPTEIPISIGAAGNAARTMQCSHASLPDGEDLVKNLKTKWGFHETLAKRVRSDRRSWYAVPIGPTGGPATGVLFSDAATAGFFGRQDSNRRKILQTAGMPIASILQGT